MKHSVFNYGRRVRSGDGIELFLRSPPVHTAVYETLSKLVHRLGHDEGSHTSPIVLLDSRWRKCPNILLSTSRSPWISRIYVATFVLTLCMTRLTTISRRISDFPSKKCRFTTTLQRFCNDLKIRFFCQNLSFDLT